MITYAPSPITTAMIAVVIIVFALPAFSALPLAVVSITPPITITKVASVPMSMTTTGVFSCSRIFMFSRPSELLSHSSSHPVGKKFDASNLKLYDPRLSPSVTAHPNIGKKVSIRTNM